MQGQHDTKTIDAGTIQLENPPAENKPVEQTAQVAPTPAVTEAKAEKKDEKDENKARPDNPIKLSNPIMVNGEELSELPWSEDGLTIDQYQKIEKMAHEKTVVNAVMELDSMLQFYLGAQLICAADPNIDIEDVKRVTGRDIFKVARVGRFFMQESED